jgi:hypothetical protein
VFFSQPLDLDMAMLKAFSAAYEAIIPQGGGPSGKKETAISARSGTRPEDRSAEEPRLLLAACHGYFKSWLL